MGRGYLFTACFAGMEGGVIGFMYLSADGGGSKIAILAFDHQCNIMSSGSGGGINLNFDSEENVRRHYLEALDGCLSGLCANTAPVFECVYYSLVSKPEIFLDCLTKRHITVRKLRPLAEAYAYLLAASGKQKGCVVLAGTGSGAALCDGPEKVVHIGGFGIPAGDDGSGAWIGIRGVNAVTKMIDGWGPDTQLMQRLAAYLQISDITRNALLNGLYPEGKGIARNVFAGFAKEVMAAADEGDLAAVSIVEEAGRLLGAQAAAVIRHHGNPEEQTEIYTCGGVWKGTPLLFQSFRAFIAGALPHAVCLPAKRDPVYAGLVQYQIEKRVR